MSNYTYGYARVSTKDQNLATQLDTLEKAGCHKIYTEKISGKTTSRPQLDSLLAGLRPGDTVIVARFFRLGRNSRHLLDLVEHFNEQGIHFKALDLGVDTTTPAGRLAFGIFAQFAQYQREELLEKTAHGRALAKAAGTHMGRKKGPDPKQYAKVKQGLEARLSVARIVELTGIPLSSVKRYVKQLQLEAQLKSPTA